MQELRLLRRPQGGPHVVLGLILDRIEQRLLGLTFRLAQHVRLPPRASTSIPVPPPMPYPAATSLRLATTFAPGVRTAESAERGGQLVTCLVEGHGRSRCGFHGQ